jgi:hypothetical protein
MPCDVNGCTNETYMGWRPLTERIGRKICEQHWTRHQNPEDSFDLFEAFGFQRPPGIPKPVAKKDGPRRAAEPDPGRKVCTQAIAEPEPPREKPSELSGCRGCGAEREPGHTFCRSCAAKRKKQSDRERQRRRYRKRQNSHAFVLE